MTMTLGTVDIETEYGTLAATVHTPDCIVVSLTSRYHTSWSKVCGWEAGRLYGITAELSDEDVQRLGEALVDAGLVGTGPRADASSVAHAGPEQDASAAWED